MSVVQEKKDKIIAAINNLPEDKLVIVEELLKQIIEKDKVPVDIIYRKVVEKYHQTLQKLAQ